MCHTVQHQVIDSVAVREKAVGLSRHALERMAERNVSHDEVQAAVSRPDRAYINGSEVVYQREDYAVVVNRAEQYVITVLYRTPAAARWASADGRPSGKVLDAAARGRIDHALRYGAVLPAAA